MKVDPLSLALTRAICGRGKAFIFPDAGVYAVAADQVHRASELLFAFAKWLKDIPKAERTYGAVVRTLASVCYGYKREKFTVHEFPKLRPPKEMDPATVTPELKCSGAGAMGEVFNRLRSYCGDVLRRRDRLFPAS